MCDNRAPQRTSSKRMALTDSWKPCAADFKGQQPIQHLVLAIDSHCRLGLGSYVAPCLRIVWRYRSLFQRESCYTVLRPLSVSSSQVSTWTNSSKTRRWQITIDLTTAVAASGICNNGMELASKTQRPTSQYRSPPFSELGDD